MKVASSKRISKMIRETFKRIEEIFKSTEEISRRKEDILRGKKKFLRGKKRFLSLLTCLVATVLQHYQLLRTHKKYLRKS